jgi:hypothetical protein
MNLGELKASLSRMSPDLDDCEVVLLTMDKKKEKYDTLAFTSYVIVKGHENPIFMMGSHDAAMKMFKDGKLKYSDGSVPDPTDLQ